MTVPDRALHRSWAATLAVKNSLHPTINAMLRGWTLVQPGGAALLLDTQTISNGELGRRAAASARLCPTGGASATSGPTFACPLALCSLHALVFCRRRPTR